MSIKAKMHYSNGLEYIVGNSSYINNINNYARINYFSKNIGDNYNFKANNSVNLEPQYTKKSSIIQYKNQQEYSASYAAEHSFAPEFFLNPSRPKARFIVDNDEARSIAEEVFELMTKEKLPQNISISILPFEEFKALHSGFGAWSGGILGFSINGSNKRVFIRENHLDALMIVIGHEIGHVLTESLPNKHDEEAKAFAFSIEWARIIKEHNVANLGLSVKDEPGLQPARNGLHDIAFAFVDFMVKKGRKAMQLHDDLARKYVSVFNALYHPK